jgi:hypothetical protein
VKLTTPRQLRSKSDDFPMEVYPPSFAGSPQ